MTAIPTHDLTLTAPPPVLNVSTALPPADLTLTAPSLVEVTAIPPSDLTLTAPALVLGTALILQPANLTLTAPPVILTGSVTITTRWTFYDPVEDETYVFPINPDSEGNPLAQKGLTFGRGRRSTDRRTTFRKAPTPMDWTFGGVIRTQEQHDALYDWVDRRRKIHIKDHLDRTFEAYLTSFEPTDRKPTKTVSWRLRYVMKAQILRQL